MLVLHEMKSGEKERGVTCGARELHGEYLLKSVSSDLNIVAEQTQSITDSWTENVPLYLIVSILK